MNKINLATLVLAIAAVMMVLTVSPAVSQDKQADNMKILLDKIKADYKMNPNPSGPLEPNELGIVQHENKKS